MKKTIIIPAVMIALATFATTAKAEVADVIPVGGVLTDLSGTPIDGNYNIAFALYDDELSSSPIWSETITSLPVDNGVFAVYLGDTVSNPIDFYTIVSSSEIWLGITVDTDSEMDLIFKWTGGTTAGLRVVHCSDAACTASTVSDVHANCELSESVDVGIGGDGLGFFAYKTWKSGDEDLEVSHCNDITCSAATNNIVTDLNDVRTPAMTIGVDGLPMITFNYYWGGHLYLAHCRNATCADVTLTSFTIGNMQQTQGTYSITIGSDNLPLVTYSNWSSDNVLRTLHSSNTIGTDGGHTIVAGSGAGAETSVTIGEDGNPLIAYRNEVDGDLMVAHCSNPLCVPYFRRR